MRLFIAIDIPSPIRDRIAALQSRLAETKADVRWTHPSLYHITLKFLGPTDDALLPEITTRLTRAAAQVPPFPLIVEGLDKFPDRGQPRIILSHIRSPDQRLTKLHRLVDSTLAGIGLPLDTRILIPHLTLGRIHSNHSLNRLLRLLAKHEFDPLGQFETASLSLYHSSPAPTGSTYHLLTTAPLQPLKTEPVA